MKKKSIEKTAAFLLVGCLLFSLLEALFVEKNSYGKKQGWKAAEDVNILILGNSHADGGFRAADMAEMLSLENKDISVFNYALYGMRMEQMLFFVKEIMKTHVPDLIILETYAFCPLADEHREILARRAFDVFPLNLNKVEAIRYCVLEDRASFYIPLIKYHTRWKELSSSDLRLLYDERLWSLTGGNGSEREEVCKNPGDEWFLQQPPQEMREITPTEKECLERFLVLLEEENIPLLFVSVPYKIQMGLDSIEQIKINNYLRETYVNGDTIRLLDMNLMWQELNFNYDDLSNEGHVNAKGADKVTACLVKYLEENYDIAALTA